MFLRYGSHTHAAGECAVQIARRSLFNEAAVAYAIRERWTIEGYLQAADATALTAAIDALVAAYAQPGQDLVLLMPDGSTPSSHRLLATETLGGPRVVSLQFPHGKDGEYSTYRRYRIEVEADIPVISADTVLLSWHEWLGFVGGGPLFVYLSTLAGPPVKQVVSAQTPYRAIQEGHAVGYAGWPLPPDPLWPTAEHMERRRIVRHAPRRSGPAGIQAYTHFETRWRYEFESDASLIGSPHAWA
jgi:hypothetical protein